MKLIRSQSTTRRTKRSMQYYQLWIYSCNWALGITSAIFAIFAAFVVADVRLSLLGGVELYHPTFLYAYVALILQCGVIQTIGCLGAQRLSHKLLSIYWIFLLLLTIGDVVVGLVWVFKLDKVKLNLRPVLTREFISKYSTDEYFTRTWNQVQSEEHCCGVDGPLDYDKLSRVQSQTSTIPNSSLIIDVESSLLSLPESCCIVIYDPAPVNSGGSLRDSLNQTYRSSLDPHEKEFSPNRSHFENDYGGGARDWINRTNFNVTNGTNNFSQYVLPDSDDNVGNTVINSVDTSSNYLISSAFNDIVSAQWTGTSQLNSEELPQADETVQDEKVSHNNGNELNLPFSPNLIKHKVRHGNHRWKLPLHNFSLLNNSSNNTLNFAKLASNETSVLSGLGEVSKEGSTPLSERRNRTRVKPKTLPSFSFPKTHSISTTIEELTVPTTTVEPEYAEKLSVPFMCQRHPRIRNKHHEHSDISQPYYQNNKQFSTLATKRLNSETDDNASTIVTTSTTESSIPSTKDDKKFDRIKETIEANDQRNNDARPNFDLIAGLTESQASHEGYAANSGNRKRRKRNSPVTAELPLTPVSSSISTDFQPLLGSHIFSFLHTSPFTPLNGDENGGEDNDGDSISGDSTISGEGNTARDIQAAYYFSSSFYQRNSLNVSLERRFHVYRHGCGVKLIQWVDHVSGILFILGFCIIGFVKACFLVILRTEIREMIEKIQILELDDPVSPSRALSKDHRLHHVSHPLLAHPHRASTVSAHAFNAALPTIKSPEGSVVGSSRFPKGYQQRRHSNIIGDRSQSHSQETVNMTLLVTNNGSQQCASGGCSTQSETRPTEKGRSNPNLTACGSGLLMGRDDFDPSGFCISVPNTSKYLRRSSTCSTSAHQGQSYSYLNYDGDPKPGPSSRFYHHDHHHMHHQHCHHGHYPRVRQYTRNMSIGAVIHHSSSSGPSGTGTGTSATTTAFRGFGGESGSGNCSFSSRDENEILSASMEIVGDQSEQQQSPSEDEKETERHEAEIRDWAEATANTSKSGNGSDGGSGSPTVTAVSLGDYTKVGFNHSSDSAESNDRSSGRRNGNNNMDIESIPLSYLGTAV